MPQEKASYTLLAKIAHWVMAVLIFTMIYWGWSLKDLSNVEYSEALLYHVIVGLLIFILAVLRISLHIVNSPPTYPESISVVLQVLAKTIHNIFYFLMIAVPITGVISVAAHELPVMFTPDFDFRAVLTSLGKENFSLKQGMHMVLANALVVLIFFHICAALFHLVYKRDGVFFRIFYSRS